MDGSGLIQWQKLNIYIFMIIHVADAVIQSDLQMRTITSS